MKKVKLRKLKPLLFVFLFLAAAAVGWTLISQIKALSPAGILLGTISPVPSVASTKGSEEKTDFVLGNLLYPGAETVRLSGNRVNLKSTDSPEAITNWYKERISQMKMGINNFVQTSANGKTVNLLNAADERGKITVEISRQSSEERTDISVSIASFK